MMSVSNVSSGAAASGYYKEEGYYKAGSPEAEKSSSWFGKAAEEIGLTGHVDDKQFAEFLEGQAPDGKEMGRYVDGERQHRPGLDLTFSASKSASVAALVIGDQRVVEAHDAAVKTALGVVEEKFVKTRFQQEGEIVTKNADGIIAGIYRHDTSRALDPNLHSHAVITNMAKNENGGYSAIRNEEIFNNRKLITEVYRSDFENRLNEQGIETQRGRYGEVNVVGISQEVVDGFSKRRQEIIQSLEGKGLENNPANAAKATLATRAAKHKDLDRSELRAEWRKEAIEFGLDEKQIDSGKVSIDAPTPAPTLRADRRYSQETAEQSQESGRFASVVDWVKNLISTSDTKNGPALANRDAEAKTAEGYGVTKAIEHLSERQSVYERSDLTTSALRFSVGASLEQVDREIDRRIEQGELFARGEHGDTLTDRRSVALEKSILTTYVKAEKTPALDLSGNDKSEGIHDLQASLAKEQTLTGGQKSAIETSLTGEGRYVGVQGYAGTGKTFMTQKLTDLAEQGGYQVKGFAPSHDAVRELSAVTGEASTLARVVMSERTHPQVVDNSKSILLVDESSMISARDMRSFMDYAERTNAARVVFVGDTKQLDAVSAGQPFAQLQAAEMRTAVMDDIQRQRDPSLRDAVYDAVRGDVVSAFQRLEDRVEQADDPRAAAAQKYLSLAPGERSETRVLTLTNAARAEINETIRTGLKAEGSLSNDGVSIDALSPRPMTGAERTDARSYAVGDIVQSLVSDKDQGLHKNALYVVQSVDAKTNTLTVQHELEGTKHQVPLSSELGGRVAGSSIVSYQQEARELAAGDSVRVRITDAQNEVVNGQRAFVTSTADGTVALQTKDGRELSLDAKSIGARGLEHDYAATSHAVQGETVDRVIVAMNSRDQLATQKAFYVEISRARDDATLITDNPRVLSENIAARTGVQVSALQAHQEGRDHVAQNPTVEAVSWAIEHLSERSSTYERAELTVQALRRVEGSDIDAIETEIDRRIEEGSLFASGTKQTTLTDKASVALESSILMTYRANQDTPGVQLEAHGGRDGAAALSKLLSGSKTLTPGQKDAVMTSLTGEGRYVGVQGYAGTGKTFMVDRVDHYAQQNGYEVKGVAPSHQAVHELSSVLGSAETLSKIVTQERHDPQDIDNSKTIYIVDESSMIGAKDMRAFMNYAERTNVARVVFVGDTQQLDAVSAGQPFDQLQDAGMRTALMDEIRRQRNVDLRGTVYDALRGDIDSAFGKLAENVVEHEKPFQEAAETYLSMTAEERSETRVLTLTNSARSEVNETIRTGLREQGQLQGPDLKYIGYVNQKLTDAERIDARSYAPGDIVVSMVNSRAHGLQKDGSYLISNFDGPRNRITLESLETGDKSIVSLGAMYNRREIGKSLVVYGQEDRSIAVGDQVRFRITDQKSGVTNGLRGEITSTEGGVIQAQTKDGKTLNLQADALAAKGIELDYAATAHAVQGETVDRVIVAMNSGERLVNQKSFYVEISRARDTATLITDDAKDLQKSIEKQTGERTTALSAWLESQRADDRDDDKNRPQERAQESAKEAPEKSHQTEKDDRAIGDLPGLFDQKTADKIQEIEKQAELILQRQRGIER